MINKKILGLFSLSEDQLTRNGSIPGVLVDVTKKMVYDANIGKYTDEISNIVATVCYPACFYEKFAVKLPADTFTEEDFVDVNERLEAGEDLLICFENLKIRLTQSKELMMTATAENITFLNLEG